MYNVHMNLFDNLKNKSENKYIVFYKNPNGGKGKRSEVWAINSYEARKKGAIIFKAKSAYDVIVVLSEQEGKSFKNGPFN